MTSRMTDYIDRMKASGMVPVRVWVPMEHAAFIKEMAKECRPEKPTPIPQRYGRRATNRHISLAKSLAKSHGKEPPEHLYDYHISLSAWMWAHGAKPVGR